ncbi:midkine precursor [Esox lucius]|uniref:Midkine n=1 Tax=Esox lucius TaxID=8010 RepID=C1BYE0_ESOLU|nr:midkine a precursor [Esox lucius]ACO14043.1 Pleiotrophic factor-alpha-2 precursor [Esox lucius]
MRGLFSTVVVLLLALMMVTTEAGKNKKEKGAKGAKGGTSDCAEWRYGNCAPSNGDCGVGVREGTCNDQTRKLKCKVPCNWKKDFGADCKYKFGTWGECDAATGSKNRSGTLKKALYNAECLPTIQVSKPCPAKTKTKTKGKKGRGKEN